MATHLMSSVLRVLREVAGRLASPPRTPPSSRTPSPTAPGHPPTTRGSTSAGGSSSPGGSTSTGGPTAAQGGTSVYPGDFHGPLTPVYAPQPDGQPDPGEIVWTWVPYEEDYTQGKDRPVLLVGRDGPWLLALQLTSQDHHRDAQQERAAGRIWVDIGSGAWDRQGRPSEVRVNRVIRVDPHGIRREGAVLREEVFVRVASAIRS